MNQKSKDLLAIEAAYEKYDHFQSIWNRFQNSKYNDAINDFLAVADFLESGSEPSFKVLRILLQRFSKEDLQLLSLLCSDSSFQEKRIIVRNRKANEKPDKGKRDRERKRQDRVNQLGIAVYSKMKDGIVKDQALRSSLSELKLNISYSTAEKDLDLFRKQVDRRGYADELAPMMKVVMGFAFEEPELKVADIPKRGRPKIRK